MLSELIVKSDWSEYNIRKTRHIDRLLFICDEEWEIDYLVKKIQTHGNWTKDQIREAIKLACYEELAPRPRGSFVRCVVKILS
jgi:Uri superfamily endonuclease